MIKLRGFSRCLYLLVIAALLLSTGGTPSARAAPLPVPPPQTGSTLTATLDPSIQPDHFLPRGDFIVRFNQAMNTSSSKEPLLTYPYVPGSSAWDTARKVLTFKPAQPYQPGSSYRVFLDPVLASSSGEKFPHSPQWTLQVKASPRVTGYEPAGGKLATRRPEIQVNFDRPMDAELTAGALSIQPGVAFTTTWDSTKQLLIHLAAPLEPGSSYQVTLARSAADQEGIPLGEDFRWNYWLDPFQAATVVRSEQIVQVEFNYDLDQQQSSQLFTLTPTLAGDWKWINNRRLQFSSKQPMPWGKLYQLQTGGTIVDKQGDPLPAPSGKLQFSLPPPISAFYPGVDELVERQSDIQITFSVPMQRASVEKAFHLEPEMKGTVTWEPVTERSDSGSETFTFHPELTFNYYATYQVTLDTSARNAAGEAVLAEPFTWNFSTWSYGTTSVTFGDWGPNAQVVDADGPRWVQYGISYVDVNTPPVKLDLYSFELGDYTQLYAQYYERRRFNQSDPIPLPEDLKPAASWTQAASGRTLQQATIPAEVPTGLYILTLSQKGQQLDQLFLILTRNTLVVKRSGEEVFVWLSDINGASLADTEVRLYSTRGEKIRQGQTDENGIYKTTVPAGYTPLLVAARTDAGDTTLSGLQSGWNSNASSWWFGGETSPSQHRYVAYTYTDRPIYRPGQTVYFKTVLRADADVHYSLPPANTPVTVRLRDARQNSVQTLELATNDFGSVDGSFQVAEGAMLGDYSLEVTLEGETYSQVFKVQDYRKPDFSVQITSTTSTLVNGDKLTLDVDAGYFFGEPVANATLTINRYRLVDYSAWWWADAEAQPEYEWYFDETIAQDKQTGADGHYRLELDAYLAPNEYERVTSWKNSAVYSTWAIEVTADDGSHQTVSNTFIYKVYQSGAILSLDTGGYLKQAKQEFKADIRATDLQGAPLANQNVDIEILTWDNSSYNFKESFLKTSVRTGPDGLAVVPLKLDQPGYYQINLSSSAELGNPMELSRWVYVIDANKSWARRYNNEINIQADQDSYKPYQTARLIIESTFSGPALLTFERGRVIHSKPVSLTAPLTLVEVQIIPEDAPNIYVKVNAWQAEPQTMPEDKWVAYSRPDARLRTAQVELQVQSSAKALQVTLAADQDFYQPRQEASFSIEVKDAQGKPAQAEVTLALVDESIFSLSNELVPPMLQAFYGRRPLSVVTFDSLAPQREIYVGGMGGGGGGPELPVNPRSNFPDTALWLPSVHTDMEGRATITVTLPDSLTSWRLTAKAVTQDTQVGEARLNVLTRQEIIVRPILPRQLTTGDQVEITALVHNYAGQANQVQVSLSGPGLEVQGSLTQTVSLQEGEVKTLAWSTLVKGVGNTEVLLTAAVGGEVKDAVRLPLNIQPLAVADFASQTGVFSGTLDTLLPLPETIQEMSLVRIELGRSVASSLPNGLEYLIGYPYGCVEQTMSRALPNAVVGRLSTQLGLGSLGYSEQLVSLINASVQRLYGFQHDDGGWGWWNDDASDDYQTAWVIFGLSVTAEAGHEIDPGVITRGAGYLKDNLERMDLRTQAFALYSLAYAGEGDLPATQALLENGLAQLDPFSQAALALALERLGASDQARRILERLEQSAFLQGSQVYWPQPHEDGHYTQKTMASTLRTTALALDAFVLIDPANPLIPGMVDYLMSLRQAYGWGSTNETSFTILALTDHLLALEKTSGETPYLVRVNDQVVSQGNLRLGQLFISVDIPAAELQAGANQLHLEAQGGAAIYYRILSRFYLPQEEIGTAGSVLVSRAYLDPKTGQALTTIKAGQLVKVSLKVKIPDGASFVLIEDQLPGGLEALNEALNTSSHGGATNEWGEPRFFWEDYGYNQKEIVGGRVTFFITDFSPGEQTLTYLARATHSGQFTALPAQVSAMYDPLVWGRSASATVAVQP